MAFPKSCMYPILEQANEDYKNTPYEDLTSAIECMRVELQILRNELACAGVFENRTFLENQASIRATKKADKAVDKAIKILKVRKTRIKFRKAYFEATRDYD